MEYLITALATLITINLWYLAKGSIETIVNSPLQSVSQIFALLGLVYAAITLFLSVKSSLIEDLTGGIDKALKLHHTLGAISFLLLLNHPLLLAINALPELILAKQYILPIGSLSYNLGVFSLYIFFLSFIFMAFIKLPYHLWKLSHQLLGVAFLLGSYHTLIIGSDVGSFQWLKIWMIFVIIVGAISFIQQVIWYRFFGPRGRYLVTSTEREADILTITMRPLGRKIDYYPGQFVNLVIKSKKIIGEMHPFSILSSPHQDELQIGIKILGDYTLALKDLKKDELAIIYGPHGRFLHSFSKYKKHIFIAGGIGVTPFVSMVRYINSTNHEALQNIHLAYCVSDEKESVYSDELANMLGANFHLWCSKNKGRLSAKSLAEIQTLDANVGIYICGPSAMMHSMREQLISIGIEQSQIHMEEFAFADL